MTHCEVRFLQKRNGFKKRFRFRQFFIENAAEKPLQRSRRIWEGGLSLRVARGKISAASQSLILEK
ncbi:MAG: hypothetical protein DBX55_01880 [Verrucomicrobia bacterium]|nr:MAG: hypothetical protein DBX55_01880 [Verrucomicrobiota bacterium]